MRRRELGTHTLTSFNVLHGVSGSAHSSTSVHTHIKHTVWVAPPPPELLKCRGGRPGEAKLSAAEGGERKGAAESTRRASARLFHGVFLSIKSVNFSQSHQRKAAFHCISRQTVCTVINCFPRCDVLCTLILCCWSFFFFSPFCDENKTVCFDHAISLPTLSTKNVDQLFLK